MSTSAVGAGDLPHAAAPRASLRTFTLGLTWLTFAISGIVFSEPAPHDALMMLLIVLLPIAGLTRFTPLIGLYFGLWLLICAGGFIAATQAGPIYRAAGFNGITLYLAIASVTIAAFVAKAPRQHLQLIFSAYMVAAVVAALTAIIGYFHLVPGAFELFTEWGTRARGTFKDPNVLGAFLAPAVVYAFHLALTRTLPKALFFSILLPLLIFAILITFSRGAMINMMISLLVYGYLSLVTARTDRERVKLIAVGMVGAALVSVVLAVSMQSPRIQGLVNERSSLTQQYDVGPEGRFGGQVRAAEVIITHPLGLGGLEFGRVFNKGADIHQVYLSMFVNAGWLGGVLYLVAVGATFMLGFRRAIQRRADGTDAIVLAVFSASVGMIGEGLIVDTDHWRHFYLFSGLIWGLAGASGRPLFRRRASDGS